jgi:hypothetical protein
MPESTGPALAPMPVAQETNAQAGKTSIGHDSLALSRSSFSSSTIPRQTLIGGEEGAEIESRQSMPNRAKVEVAQKTEVQRVSCPPAPDATPNSKDLNDASLLDPCSVFMNSFEGNDSFQFSDKDDSMVVDLPIVTDESLAAEKQAAEAAGDRIIDGSQIAKRKMWAKRCARPPLSPRPQFPILSSRSSTSSASKLRVAKDLSEKSASPKSYSLGSVSSRYDSSKCFFRKRVLQFSHLICVEISNLNRL